jgi:hypothetical protein
MVGITGPFAVDLGKPKEELKIKKIYIYSICFFDFKSLVEESNPTYLLKEQKY